MKFKLLILSIMITVLSATTSDEVVAETLCNRGEYQYFSCNINDSNKIVSICGNADLEKIDFEFFKTDESAYIQYRFGTKNNIELLFPQEKKYSINKFYGQDIRGYLVSIVNINFRIGQYQYVVESSSSAEGNESVKSFAGILVYKAGQKHPQKYSCKSDAFFDHKKNINTFGYFSKIAQELENANGNGSE